MNLRALSLGVAVVLSLTGCPGGSGGDGGTGGGNGGSGGGHGGGTGTGGGTGGTVPLDQLCAQLESNYCDYFVRCGAFESKSNCLTFFGGLVTGRSCAVTQVAGVDAGLIMYNGQAAASCLNSLASSACEGFNFGGADVCQQVFVGTVGIGSACGFEGECLPTAYCDTGGASCGGTCKALIAVGQPAGPGDQCVKGAQPVGGVCFAEVPAGGNCGAPDGGFDFLPCASPSSCYPDFLNDGGINATCTQDAVAGQPCTNLDAGIRGCGGFTHCDNATNRCVAAGGTDAGCSSSADFACKLDLWCNTAISSPICQALSPIGGPCVDPSSCLDGLCDGGRTTLLSDGGTHATLGACVGLPGVNDHCSGSCATGLYCDFSTSTCQAKKADGQSCMGQSECQTGTCSLPGDGGSGTCGPCR